jgi:diguanylate cyclase (GGDEF)-like protein
VGDEVLRNFATQAKRLLRETDVIARWGGEEFLLLIPEVPSSGPVVGIDRLREALHKLELSMAAPTLRMTFSAGVTDYRAGESVEEAIDRADKALYQAKVAGRDRVIAV